MYRLLALLALAAPAAALDVQGIDQHICPGETITLRATGAGSGGEYGDSPYTFETMDGQELEQVTLTQTTSYKVTGSDATENSDTDYFNVTLLDSAKCCTQIDATSGQLSPAECTRVPSYQFHVDNTAGNLLAVSSATVTEIGDNAFLDNMIKTINMPQVTLIGEEAFKKNFDLTTISMPQVTFIGAGAFGQCALATVNLPEATTIGNNAFKDNSNLATVNLPQVTTIGAEAFGQCALATINMPQVTLIGEQAFKDNFNLATVNLPKVVTIGSKAFESCPVTGITMSAPEYVASDAFDNNMEGITLTIPDAVTTIPANAFNGHAHGHVFAGLTSIVMPNVITIEVGAFLLLQALTTVSMPKVTMIKETAFERCTALAEVIMPEVTTIEQGAFQGNTALTTVSMPKVTTIGTSAFQGNTALTTVSMPEVTTIEQGAFYGLTALTTVSMPKVTTIGASAFQGNTALTTVMTMSNVLNIHEKAFQGCSSLRMVYLPTLEGQYSHHEAFDTTTLLLHQDCSSGLFDPVFESHCLTLGDLSDVLPTQAFVEAAIDADQAQAVADAWGAKGQTCSGSGA